jgi:hypothetical protein
MFELLARLFRVLWRQDLGGTGGSAVILDFQPAGQPVLGQEGAKPAAAPVDFIRQAGHAASQAGQTAPVTRHLSAQLHSVSRLNGPSNRARRPSASARANKPKPMAATAPLKRTPAVKPGVVIGRIARPSGRDSAAIVNLAEVRAEARRATMVEAVDREIVALFN